METIKTSPNVEFDVIYADGTRRRVKEGVLFEVEEDQMIFHNGTSRARVLFAAAESALALIDDIGLLWLFDSYIRSDPEDCNTIRILAKLSSKAPQHNSAEKQAIFRLGQMDMRESMVAMLREAGDNVNGVVGATLHAAAALIRGAEVPCSSSEEQGEG